MAESLISYQNRVINLSTEELNQELDTQKDIEKLKFVASTLDRRKAREEKDKAEAKRDKRQSEIADEYTQTVRRWYSQGVQKYKGAYRYKGQKLFAFKYYGEPMEEFIVRVREADTELQRLKEGLSG